MKRIFASAISVFAVAAVAGAAMPACAANDQSIFVRGVLAPSTNRQNGSCLYTGDAQQPLLFEGRYDVGVRDNYFVVMLVGSQMIARGDPSLNRAESNNFHVLGGIVNVTDPNGNTVTDASGKSVGEFTSSSTGYLDTQNNNAASYAPMGVTLIDRDTRNVIEAGLRGADGKPDRTAVKLYVANVKVFGKTLGGDDVESGEFQFPIRICNGCLVVGATDTTQAGPNCLLPLGGSSSGTTTLPCQAGEEESTPCQLCKGRYVCDNPL